MARNVIVNAGLVNPAAARLPSGGWIVVMMQYNGCFGSDCPTQVSGKLTSFPATAAATVMPMHLFASFLLHLLGTVAMARDVWFCVTVARKLQAGYAAGEGVEQAPGGAHGSQQPA